MTASAEAATSVVYVIGNADNRLVKIGWTTQAKLKRLGQIQTMSPSILKVLWTTPGGRPLEDALHSRFLAERRHGEWFDFGDRDPVATVSEAVGELTQSRPATTKAGADDEGLGPGDSLSLAVWKFRQWALREPDAVGGLGTLGYCANELADVAAMQADLSDDKRHASFATRTVHALRMARDLTGAEWEEDSFIGIVMTPAATIAGASNLRRGAEVLADEIGYDEYALQSPAQAASYLRHVAQAVGHLCRSINMADRAMGDAADRGDVQRDEIRAALSDLRHVTFSIEKAAVEIDAAAIRLSGLRHRGFQADNEDDLRRGVLDELSARDLLPEVGEAQAERWRVSFDYAGELCSLGRDRNGDWTVYVWDRTFWNPAGVAGAYGAGIHPVQVVSWALGVLEWEIDGRRDPRPSYRPGWYYANPRPDASESS